jgi:hypothetical protein
MEIIFSEKMNLLLPQLFNQKNEFDFLRKIEI